MSDNSNSPPEKMEEATSPSDTVDNQELNIKQNNNFTDEEFEAFLSDELEKSPLYKDYPTVFQAAPKIMTEWRQRYRGNPSLWKRLFDKDRVLKEFIEAAPVIDAVKRLVESTDLQDGKKFTIFDLACGRGYLSMMLSHFLSAEKVKKIVLVDKQWPMHNTTPQPHHISWTHIYGSHKECEDQSIPCYFDTWPIELHTSKSVSILNTSFFAHFDDHVMQVLKHF